MTTIAFILMGLALLLVATSNGVQILNNRQLVTQAASARRNLFQNWAEISRCQKANAALRERVGKQRLDILDLQTQLATSQRALEEAQNAAQQPLPVDPDQEPTFAEIVTEVASHVSSLTTSTPVVEGSTAPEPVQQQVVAGMVVTTPNGFDVSATDITDDAELIDGMD